jgi:hypothetical protein
MLREKLERKRTRILQGPRRDNNNEDDRDLMKEGLYEHLGSSLHLLLTHTYGKKRI